MLKWYSILVVDVAIGRLTFTRFSPQLLKMRFFFWPQITQTYDQYYKSALLLQNNTVEQTCPLAAVGLHEMKFGPFFITIDV